MHFCLSSKRLQRLEKLAKNKEVLKKHTEAITAGLRINELLQWRTVCLSLLTGLRLTGSHFMNLPLTFYLTFSFDNWVGVNIFGRKNALML